MRASLLLLVVAACGSKNPPSNPDGALPGDSAQADAPPANLDPEKWEVDVSECPTAFRTQAPVAGLNNGFMVGNQSRSFVLILPSNGATGPRPLFVGFNGTSENGTTFANRAKLSEFAAAGFIVLAPSSANNGAFWPIWDAMRSPGTESQPNPDLAYFDMLTNCTAAHFEVDKKRIYVGGHSAGGIFTNRVLRSRSQLVAGGIVGSGVFSFTGDGASAPATSPVFAIVTWGGDNDEYSGTTPSGVTVPRFSFVEQASLASRHYEALPEGSQVACRGNNIGHAWLPLNSFFIEALLAHPKGAPANAPLPALPSTAQATCSNDAYVLPPAPANVCAASSATNCQAACQFMADCLVENQTVGPVMEDQITDLGFTATTCGGCITRCEQAAAASAANRAVLQCLANAAAANTCGPGIEGSLPFMTGFNTCCSGRTDSTLCVSACGSFDDNEAITPFFPVCNSI